LVEAPQLKAAGARQSPLITNPDPAITNRLINYPNQKKVASPFLPVFPRLQYKFEGIIISVTGTDFTIIQLQ
jgi:hypothetical protein